MNTKNLIQMICLLLVGFMTPMTQQPSTAADPDWTYPDVELPTAQLDDFDYNLYWAFPRTCRYYNDIYIDGEFDHSTEDKCFIESLGFHTRITSVRELRRGNR
ncbi:MAG: hypothetical protein WBD20_02440 [Pirellulaceae bacterium]